MRRIARPATAGIVLAAATIAAAAPAETGGAAWTAFKSRCLDPVAGTGAADLSGLTKGEAVVHNALLGAPQHYEVTGYDLGGGVELAIVAEPDRSSHGCGVATRDAEMAEASGAAADRWLQAELDAGEWRATRSSLLGPRYARVWDGPYRLLFGKLAVEGALVLTLDHVKRDD